MQHYFIGLAANNTLSVSVHYASQLLCRHFRALPSRLRNNLAEALCSGLTVLSLSAQGLAPSDARCSQDDSQPEETLQLLREATQAHQSALKAYAFFITWLISECQQVGALVQQTSAPHLISRYLRPYRSGQGLSDTHDSG